MEETYSNICQLVYNNKKVDISDSQECKDLYKKIANKYLNKYKRHKSTDLEACKRDIQDYSVGYFCKRLHGKPKGKIGNPKDYSSFNEPKNESTLPILSEREVLDLAKQKEVIQKKDKIYRNLFSSETRKVVFAVNTGHRDDLTTSGQFTINLQDKNIVDLKNVIGFNLLRAQIPNGRHLLHDHNYQSLSQGDITRGNYDVFGLESQLVTDTSLSSVTYEDATGLFNFGADITTEGVTQADKSLARILGLKFNTSNYTSVSNKSVHKVDVRANTHFDIEIEEIPSIACIQTEHSKNIIARKPVSGMSGDIENYIATESDIIKEYFTPQRLPKLTIRFLDEYGLLIDFNGLEAHFTFEAVVLKNVPDMGIVMEN